MGLDSPIDIQVNGKKKDCTCRECWQGILSMLILVFAGLALAVYFIYLNGTQEETNKILDEVEHYGKETTCMYSLEHSAIESSASCSYKASYEECDTFQSDGQRSCRFIPSEMKCDCPIKWNQLNAARTVLTIIPDSYDADTNSDKSYIKATEALNNYEVDLRSLCANAEVCERFNCDYDGCCTLGMYGHPEGILDYCGDECYARADKEFDCVALNNGILYGGSFEQIRAWNEAHVSFFFLLCLILGIFGVLTALITAYCFMKTRAYRKEHPGQIFEKRHPTAGHCESNQIDF